MLSLPMNKGDSVVMAVNTIERNPCQSEQTIYEHLLTCVRNESQAQVLQRFYQLFILNHSYSDTQVRETLDRVLLEQDTVEHLLPFFNRCCYILVNRWQMTAGDRVGINELIAFIKQVNTPGNSHQFRRSAKRLRQLVYLYSQSHYFNQLCRLAEFTKCGRKSSGEDPLMSLIDRYPYLYSHCLVSHNDDQGHQDRIRQAKHKAQRQFEKDLSQYMTLSAMAGRQSLQSYADQNYHNPTLLPHKDLCASLQHFIGPSTMQGGYRSSAKQFITVAKQQRTFQSFKDHVHDYIIADLDPGYAQCKFSQQLRQSLDVISPEHHHQPMTNLLMNRTFTQLMNFLVIESARSPKHFVFMDLISNLGTTQTVGLLLKIVLLEKSVKKSLERRLSVLFNHYENHKQAAVGWLVRCLEKFQLAFTSHFSRIDFSYLTVL